MKKQVTFAKSQPLHTLHQDEALLRDTGKNESQIAFKDVGVKFSSGLKPNRPPPARCEPSLQHVTTRTTAPFLTHTALTPAQREYLCTIAASYSTVHVRSLITQHYMNVLHRCRRAGCRPERDFVSSVACPGSDQSERHQSEVPSKVKHESKISTSAKSPGKSFFPKIPNRPARLPNTSSASKQANMKNHRTSPSLRGKSPRRAKIRLSEEEEEEGLDDPLSECLGSLSVGEWDDDSFSDL